MELLRSIVFVVLVSISYADVCEDVDTKSCEILAALRPDLCSNPCLSKLCTRHCGHCPVKCYQCHEIDDPSNCTNLIACPSADHYCYTTQTFTDDFTEVYKMGCAIRSVCQQYLGGAESMTRNIDVNGACCMQDKCNNKLPLVIMRAEVPTTQQPGILCHIVQVSHYGSRGSNNTTTRYIIVQVIIMGAEVQHTQHQIHVVQSLWSRGSTTQQPGIYIISTITNYISLMGAEVPTTQQPGILCHIVQVSHYGSRGSNNTTTRLVIMGAEVPTTQQPGILCHIVQVSHYGRRGSNNTTTRYIMSYSSGESLMGAEVPTTQQPVTFVNTTADPNSCKNLDDGVCQRLALASPGICSDTCFADNVCPRMCGSCLNCYTCNDIDNITDCTTINVCQSGHECFTLETLSIDLRPVFRVGCIEEKLCSRFQASTGNIFGRRDGFSLKGGCCKSDLCNDHVETINNQLTTTTTQQPTTLGCNNLHHHCPAGFHSLDSSCYMIGLQRMSWQDAKVITNIIHLLFDIVSIRKYKKKKMWYDCQ
ncbi:Hypothetical predicted protein [Mytilus galloprovincialis]|uniref:UPAR/Ly6 domain-containing protein n=1 Tax=Mytilus galloprovincialis TaxID=29158 RepID=A0A8B6DA82_MYTGA|nr:Hypothetical predicted protein [Mytilus galloprovincialis]